jgi:hypothetical protein
MFKMRSEQFAAFSAEQDNGFVLKSLIFLESGFPDWCSERDESQKKQFVTDSIRLAREHHLYRERSIQRLMFLQIRYPEKFPLSEFKGQQLSRKGLAEDYRIDQLRAALKTDKDPTVIRLD